MSLCSFVNFLVLTLRPAGTLKFKLFHNKEELCKCRYKNVLTFKTILKTEKSDP